MADYLCIIQARLGSSRFPNKVMETVGGIPIVKRVWLAAKTCAFIDKVIVAWPERYPDLDERDVLERFRRVSDEFPSEHIIRLTADCPLITSNDIRKAVVQYEYNLVSPVTPHYSYYNNRTDGRDVQIFSRDVLFTPILTDKEHVIRDVHNHGGLSVNTKSDLKKVRSYAR